MDVQEILAQIDHAVTEIDLELHQWQEDLDMMSFIGQDVPLKLWTNDDPPKVLTLANAINYLQETRKQVRVMHHVDGAWTQIGTAEMDVETGVIKASIDQSVPELERGVLGAFSIRNEFENDRLPSEKPFQAEGAFPRVSLEKYFKDDELNDFREGGPAYKGLIPNLGQLIRNAENIRNIPFVLWTGDRLPKRIGYATVNGNYSIRSISDPFYNEIYQSGKRDLYEFFYNKDRDVVECKPLEARPAVEQKHPPFDDAVSEELIENHRFFKES